MEHNFSPSINIVRDNNRDIHYIPTSNSKNIYKHIVSNFSSGVHSFNIIGSYGTGKSAFLLAFIKHLNGEEQVFTPLNGQLNGCKKFEFVNIIGQSRSMIATMADELNIEADENTIFSFLRTKHSQLKKQDTCLVLIVDEFGKFLEHAAKHDPDRELYFIQRLAEFANDSRRNFLFLTTLHQNFDAYAIGLDEAQRKEWEKVKGRLKELTFNEPVEQLLSLAADFISEKDFGERQATSKKLIDTINKTGAFNLLNELSDDFASALYPFDLLSAMILTLSLQKYGQNERSLFNFLQTDEFLGLNSFQELKEKNPYYNLACVYNYLQYNYYSVITSKYNPDYFKWSMIRNSLERAELELTENVINAQKLIMTIGLLDILGSKAAKINQSLLVTYGKECLGIRNTKAILATLESKKIIRYQAFKNRYKLFEGTDVNIEELQENAKKEIGEVTNVVAELQNYFKQSFVPAKAVTYKKGTPRIFEFQLSDYPIEKFHSKHNEVDGIINIVFNEKLRKTDFAIKGEPVLYGLFKRPQELRDHILEIKAVDKALTEVVEDPVAKKEFVELKGHLTETLNFAINEKLFGGDSNVRWFYEGEEVKIQNLKFFNQQLSTIADKIYHATPAFRNELMNKSKVSSSIHFAKKQYIEALIEHWNKPDLGFDDNKMPPEKTIFYTLLRNTGIHKDINSVVAEFSHPNEDSTFTKLWEASEAFLDGTRSGKRPLSEFINILSRKPFKLKDGFIEFWVISFLFIKREDYALFKEKVYRPRFVKEDAELFFKKAKYFEVKAFDIQGVKLDLYNKYREITQLGKEEQISGTGFQTMALPFLVFYKNLTRYAQETKSLSHDALAFRKVIKNARELEKTFFEDLPTCFGYSLDKLAKSKNDLEDFVARINSCITELRTAQDKLVSRIETQMLNCLGMRKTKFSTYKPKMQNRYATIKTHLLNPRQKTLFNRINSQIPDKKAWIGSLVQTLLNKQLTDINDKEELIILDRFKTAFTELDNLVELSQMTFDEETEEAVKIEITSSETDSFQKNIILSKEQKRGAKSLEKRFREVLAITKDNQTAQAILIKLLKEISKDE